jgi:hypothetical protein
LHLKAGGREFQDCRGRVDGLLAKMAQDAQRKNGRELVAALLGRQIGLRISWRIEPRFGHDVAQTRE